MAESSSSTAKQRKRGHCDQLLTIRVFKRHRDLYFNPVEKKWKRTADTSSDEGEPEEECFQCTEEMDDEAMVLADFTGDCYILSYSSNCSVLLLHAYCYTDYQMDGSSDCDHSSIESEYWSTNEEDILMDTEAGDELHGTQNVLSSSKELAVQNLVH